VLLLLAATVLCARDAQSTSIWLPATTRQQHPSSQILCCGMAVQRLLSAVLQLLHPAHLFCLPDVFLAHAPWCQAVVERPAGMRAPQSQVCFSILKGSSFQYPASPALPYTVPLLGVTSRPFAAAVLAPLLPCHCCILQHAVSQLCLARSTLTAQQCRRLLLLCALPHQMWPMGAFFAKCSSTRPSSSSR
jgi:hypothetical protein